MGNSSLQEEQYEFFKSHLKEFLDNKQLKNKFVVIAEGKDQGFHDTFAAAYEAALAQFAPDSFIVQQVVEDNDSISFLAMAV